MKTQKNTRKAAFWLQNTFVLATSLSALSCSGSLQDEVAEEALMTTVEESASYAEIDFSHWKITLPVDLNNDGKPDEYQPSSLINNGYRSIPELQPFMYDDTTDAAIVFRTYPGGATTTNSSYPRTELREQQTPGNNYNNWSLTEGGTMRGTLKIDTISPDLVNSKYDNHRVIVMQIHGIISQADMATYGFSSNHAPPLLKMTWIDGHLFAYKKTLVDESTSGIDLYDDSSATWTDIKHDFGDVGFGAFTVEIEASYGELSITVDDETHVFDDISMEKWPFENYFKAGNYLVTTDTTGISEVKYYELEVTHP
ncbi:polysaccharide lyase family 7 protein [Sinomicrobium oceani]|uniref:polysaccharide lyase family 7 protein n=1 Tax=Sinomicrobium oceani TaxID=1150368 RepID=UPI00227AB3A2|nr:polysaccharide lyase family 7 protein [Sinomicrobium oceani]